MESTTAPLSLPKPAPGTSGLAVASLILGILSILPLGQLVGIPAIVCGHLSLRKLKHQSQRGKDLAISGLFFAYFSLAVFILLAGVVFNISWDLMVSKGLHLAAKKGRLNDAAELLAQGADINEFKSAGTPLHFAAGFGQVDMIDFLLDNGADIESWIEPIGTPLIMAASAGRKESVNALLQKGADVFAVDSTTMRATAMHLAALHGYSEIVEMLLQHGADPSIQDLAGRTPADAANFGKQYETEDLIRRYQARILQGLPGGGE